MLSKSEVRSPGRSRFERELPQRLLLFSSNNFTIHFGLKKYNFVAARKSSHRFPTIEEEAAALIDNFSPVYFTDGTFWEVYFFNFTDPSLGGSKPTTAM